MELEHPGGVGAGAEKGTGRVIWVAYILIVLGSIAGCVYLVATGHPWFGFLVLLIALLSEVKIGHKKDGIQ